MKNDEKLYFCMGFVNNQHSNKEIWKKKQYHLNDMGQNFHFYRKQNGLKS